MIQDHNRFSAARAYGGDVGERVARFVPLVRKLAWHFAGSGGPTIDADDLMQAGLVALTECAQKHQGPGEDGFAAYAKMRVRGAMIDLLRRSSATPRSARENKRRIEEARARLTVELGEPPTEPQLAEALNLTLQELRDIVDAADVQTVSLEAIYPDIESSLRSDAPDPEECAVSNEDRETLVRAIGALPERQAMVIQLYFVEELNLAEIAQVLDISVPRVHQIKAAALAKLRGEFE